MGERQDQPRVREGIASGDEVRQAIESLTEADMAKLKRAAEVLVFKVRRQVWGICPADLLQEAMLSVLEQGRRNWNPSRVEFVGLLIGAMRSIATNWRRKGKSNLKPPISASDLTTRDQKGEEIPSPLAVSPDPQPNPEEKLLHGERMTEEELVSEIEAVFHDDVIAACILEGWKSGMKGPEIRRSLEVSEREFNTAVRRIRRTVAVRWPKGKPYVQ